MEGASLQRYYPLHPDAEDEYQAWRKAHGLAAMPRVRRSSGSAVDVPCIADRSLRSLPVELARLSRLELAAGSRPDGRLSP